MDILRRIKSRVFRPIRWLIGGLRRRFCAWNDYRLYANRVASFRKVVEKLPSADRGSLLIVSGRGMNVLWAQIWSVVSLAARVHGYKGIVLTTRQQEHLNRYFRLLDLELMYYHDFTETVSDDLPEELAQQVKESSTFDDFRDLYHKNAPIGQIALSTYSRYKTTGIIDLDKPETREAVIEWIKIVCQAIHIAELIYAQCDVKLVYINELFFEEYAGFYYAALSEGLNITKFTGTVRDRAFILQHMKPSNDRLHHAALAPSTWEMIKNTPFTNVEEEELDQNFRDRYSDMWFRSFRNHRNTRIMPVDEARQILGIAPGRRVAVIFSHILYDSLFFFGTDLFDDYARWLVATVRAASQNPSLDWLVKVHPSNAWRGELNSALKGTYEEERLIAKYIGTLPPHVRIVHADNVINPLTWFQLTDFGVTVRGTSGLEVAALGKPVITGGTGRYDRHGFTIDPEDKEEYRFILEELPDIEPLVEEQVSLAKRYAHALFVLKPFEFDFFEVAMRSGAREVVASDDLVYLPGQLDGSELPGNLKRLSQWVVDDDSIELI